MNEQTILVVDDDDRLAESFKVALRMNGYATEVVSVHDGQAALDWLFGNNDYDGRDTSVVPRLILLDLSMTGMGGMPCLNRIRADRRTELLPVVVLTISDAPQDKTDAYKAGANGYVDKISDIPFPEMVMRIAHYWLDVNKPAPLAYYSVLR